MHFFVPSVGGVQPALWLAKIKMLTPETVAEVQKLYDKDHVSFCTDLIRVGAINTEHKQVTKECRLYYKKIAQLTHPDKLMRFSAKDKVQLIAILHQAKEDLVSGNISALIFHYMHVRHIRGELHKVDQKLLEHAHRQFQWLNAQLKHLLSLPFIPAVEAYASGNIQWAKILFTNFISEKASKNGSAA